MPCAVLCCTPAEIYLCSHRTGIEKPTPSAIRTGRMANLASCGLLMTIAVYCSVLSSRKGTALALKEGKLPNRVGPQHPNHPDTLSVAHRTDIDLCHLHMHRDWWIKCRAASWYTAPPQTGCLLQQSIGHVRTAQPPLTIRISDCSQASRYLCRYLIRKTIIRRCPSFAADSIVTSFLSFVDG